MHHLRKETLKETEKKASKEIPPPTKDTIFTETITSANFKNAGIWGSSLRWTTKAKAKTNLRERAFSLNCESKCKRKSEKTKKHLPFNYESEGEKNPKNFILIVSVRMLKRDSESRDQKRSFGKGLFKNERLV